ncbi:lipase [Plectosphaerella plurivora]|uniref:Patatin-like phospholipase domain-containing protein n=1 Tax=Plectosphaerella plurivora TaxID=936078 RepID=A0A9P8VHM1_9PEZI|nr:lipase [Plectosphaerella plurivora]
MAEAPNTNIHGFPPEAFDTSKLPDYDTIFVSDADIEAFITALQAPDPLQSPLEDTTSLRSPGARSFSFFEVTKRDSQVIHREESDPNAVAVAAAAQAGDMVAPPSRTPSHTNNNMFITAQNDWAPVNERVHKRGKRRNGRAKGAATALLGTRTKDETREGYLYVLLKWPMLFFVVAWLAGLAMTYLYTRLYIWVYEHFITWRGRRQQLRMELRKTNNYRDWVSAARELDDYLGRQRWKEENDFAYYDSKTVRRVWEQLRKCRLRAEAVERGEPDNGGGGGGSDEAEIDRVKGKKSDVNKDRPKAVEELKALLQACVKNNFVGVENPRLYSQTYYGTKNLVQNFVDEVEKSIKFLLDTKQLSMEEKRAAFKGMHANYGRTALCLSGGAAFAYYHFGVVKALLEADFLPEVITGTSGGALVAALVATRTDEELKQLLVPALAGRITACSESMTTWVRRWWKTGARFDSIKWARDCSWWTHGSMTFREAYERTGRILNVSCVPADPHSPTILCNYLTSPDCVIWSAVIASAAVPGILNPVVLMMKQRDGTLAPYSFGHKWKDGSLRTDIPIKALNLHFNVNFTIVSQVNPHINLFFFSSRGSVGHPVTHRKGKGWRGGYVMSAVENYLKLDMTKWLKFIRHAELLPRPLGQDWSQLFLQQFSGTITIWPKTEASDFWHILSDPEPARLARMLHEGQQRGFPIIKFVGNRLKAERLIERGRRETRPWVRRGSIETILSEDDLRSLLRGATDADEETTDGEVTTLLENDVAVTDDEEEEEFEGVEMKKGL